MSPKKEVEEVKEVEEAPWRTLTVEIAQAGADWVQGLLLDEGALGIQVEDDETRAVPGKAMAPTGRASILATFGKGPGLEARVVSRLAKHADEIPGGTGMELHWADLHQEDWVGNFKAHWKSLSLTPKTWVVPSWEREDFQPPPDCQRIIEIDPGMAFGTGSHATTMLCARALEDHLEAHLDDQVPLRILDVGTGTGILAILAAQMGVKKIVGTDVDPAAIRAAMENAEKNNVASQIDFMSADADPGEKYPLVVANILANILIGLVDFIGPRVAPGGTLLLSGILVAQKDSVVETYEGAGFAFSRQEELEGWVCLFFRKD
jgi:ribosomal protein L11 methyltransferase